MLSEVRIQRLAKLYGPNLRFYPDGSEALDKAIDEGEKAQRTPEEQAAIDKARAAEQAVEQEKATARRANEAARESQSRAEALQQEKDALQQKLEEAEAKAAQAGIKDVELNEEDYEHESDQKLVRAINALKLSLTSKDKELTGVKKKISDYEAQIRREKADEAATSQYEELLSDLDEEYGAENRNAAVEKFNELIRDGKVPKGQPAKAARIMEKCYKEVKAEKGKEKKADIPLDSGSGGGESPNLSGIEVKEGSLDEVAAQYGAALGKKT